VVTPGIQPSCKSFLLVRRQRHKKFRSGQIKTPPSVPKNPISGQIKTLLYQGFTRKKAKKGPSSVPRRKPRSRLPCKNREFWIGTDGTDVPYVGSENGKKRVDTSISNRSFKKSRSSVPKRCFLLLFRRLWPGQMICLICPEDFFVSRMFMILQAFRGIFFGTDDRRSSVLNIHICPEYYM